MFADIRLKSIKMMHRQLLITNDFVLDKKKTAHVYYFRPLHTVEPVYILTNGPTTDLNEKLNNG